MAHDLLGKLIDHVAGGVVNNRILLATPLLGKVLAGIKKRNLLGLGLPKRDQTIYLYVANLRYKANLPFSEELTTSWKALFEEGEYNRLVDKIGGYVGSMNIAGNVPQQERFDRLQMASLYLAPILENYYFRFRKQVNPPINAETGATLKAGLKAAETLTKGFAILFDHYYHRSNFRYAKIQHRIPVVAFRILELIWILQHLSALQSRRLSRLYLAMANKLFFMLREHETDGDTKILLTKSNMVLPARGTATFQVNASAGITFQDLYLRVQLWAMADPLRWQPDHLHWLSGLLSARKNALLIAPYEGKPLGRHQRYIAFNQQCPPSLQTPPTAEIPAYVLDPGLFLEELGRNLQEAGKWVENPRHVGKVDPFLCRLNPSDRLRGLQNLHRDFSRDLTDSATDRFRINRDLRLFLTFKSSFTIIQNRYDLDLEAFLKKFQLQLSLARDSSVLMNIEENRDEDELNLWQTDSRITADGEILFRLVEEDRTRTFRIGTMVSFAKPPEFIFSIGYITRIVRRQDRLMDFSLRLLSRTTQPATIQRYRQDREPQPALLYKEDDRTFCVYHRQSPNHLLLDAGATVFIPVRQTLCPFRLGTSSYSGPEIIVRALLPATRRPNA